MPTHIPVQSLDSDVPVPIEVRVRYPLNEMEVNQSFLFSNNKAASVRSRASRIKKATGKEFVTMKENDEQIRIWRTK